MNIEKIIRHALCISVFLFLMGVVTITYGNALGVSEVLYSGVAVTILGVLVIGIIYFVRVFRKREQHLENIRQLIMLEIPQNQQIVVIVHQPPGIRQLQTLRLPKQSQFLHTKKTFSWKNLYHLWKKRSSCCLGGAAPNN